MLAAGTTRPVVVAFVTRQNDPRQGVVYSAHMAEGETVWSFHCTHLHHTVTAARKCFPRLAREWRVWGALPRVPVSPGSALVEIRLGAAMRRMLPVTHSVVAS